MWNPVHYGYYGVNRAGSPPDSSSQAPVDLIGATKHDYVIGKFLAPLFENLSEKIWPKAPVELARKQFKIYQDGLLHCAERLEAEISNLKHNPESAAAWKRVDEMAHECAEYLKPIQEYEKG